MNRIKDKIKEIQNYLEELTSILPKDFQEYFGSIEKKAACERYFEKIVESSIDLTYLVLKKLRYEITEEINVFEILNSENVISEKLFNKLKNAKGMRNLIAHRYGEVDDEIIFGSLIGELIPDIEDFLKSIENYIKED